MTANRSSAGPCTAVTFSVPQFIECVFVVLVRQHGDGWLADSTTSSATTPMTTCPLPGTDSQKATDTLAKSFPSQANGTSPIVLHASSGKLTDSKYASAVIRPPRMWRRIRTSRLSINPLTPQGASALSKDQATGAGYLSVTLATVEFPAS